MTAPTTASNGHTKPQPTPERTHGMARVQEAEGWHLASVARDAVGEAERLCSDIMHVASAAYTRRDGSRPRSPIPPWSPRPMRRWPAWPPP